jgi:hypothetical protein
MEALMFGSLMILVCPSLTRSPSSARKSGICWLSVRDSGKFAMILPAREIFFFSKTIPVPFV